MLRSYSNEARANIRAYIINHFDPCDYDIEIEEPYSFPEVARVIYKVFCEEKQYYMPPNEALFIDWTQGLSSILDCCYWYNRPAVDDLAKILEMDTTDILKYRREGYDDRTVEYNYLGEAKASRYISGLIWREITRNI